MLSGTTDRKSLLQVMQRIPLLALAVGTITLLAGCTTTHDLPEKYAAYIGKQFRTRVDGYIWKMPRHEYEFYPYVIKSSWPLGIRLDHIPAGTVVTVKAAKRSYKGGDWDYLIAEVRAPESGKVYTFEDMLGFSTYLPKDIEKFLEPLEKPAEAGELFNSENFFNAPNGRFSIPKTAFPTPPQQWSATEPPEIGTFSFYFSKDVIVRVDYWNAQQQPLAKWTRDSNEANVNDRTLDGVINFTRAKTSGLKELSLLARRPNDDLGGTMSSAAFRMRIEGGQYAGSYYRGFLTFSYGTDSYALHYQTGDTFSDDKSAGDAIIERLIALRDAIVFHN